MRKHTRTILVLTIFCLLTVGCQAPDIAYLKADEGIYNASQPVMQASAATQPNVAAMDAGWYDQISTAEKTAGATPNLTMPPTVP